MDRWRFSICLSNSFFSSATINTVDVRLTRNRISETKMEGLLHNVVHRLHQTVLDFQNIIPTVHKISYRWYTKYHTDGTQVNVIQFMHKKTYGLP